MRTAITLSKSHAGKWSLVSGPDVPLDAQKKSFRALRAVKAHKEIAEVVYQESDGHQERIRMITLEAAEKEKKQRAEAEAEAKKMAEAAKLPSEREKAEADFKAATKAALEEEKKREAAGTKDK